MVGVEVDCFFFFFNDTATTEIYTLSLHDALPIYCHGDQIVRVRFIIVVLRDFQGILQHLERHSVAEVTEVDRKSTRLNSSHSQISYAVFCLKKKTSRPSASCRDPAT